MSVAGLLLLAFIIPSICISVSRNNRTVKIAFVNLPEKITAPIQKQITNVQSKDIKFEVINEDKVYIRKLAKYNMIITWNGKIPNLLKDSIQPISKDIPMLIPSAIKKSTLIDNDKEILPLLLDHYEIAYYRTYRKANNLGIPGSLKGLENYMQVIKEKATYPLIVQGATDSELLGFVSVVASSIYDDKQYDKLVKDVSKFVDSQKELPKSLNTVLDKIREWQKEGLIHPQWTDVIASDTELFMREHQLGSICMSLSEHREKEFVLIKYYDAIAFPRNTNIPNHYLIAPEVVAIPLKSKVNLNRILETLINPQTQSELSTKTQLSACASRAESYDSLSDDVRFWAASYASGPAPDIGRACCKDPTEEKFLADKIREAVRK